MYKVMIVEDEDLIRKGLVYMFDWIQHDCVVVGEAANGIEAKTIIEDKKPDILITDIRMPLMDGLELISSLKDAPIKTVIISGYDEFDYAKKAIRYGVSDYILKPIDNKILASTIKRIIESIENQTISDLIGQRLKSFEDIELYDKDIFYRKSEFRNRYTLKVLSFVEENYTRKISIDYIADILEVSSAYLSKKFKEDIGHTFNDFVNRYRLHKALDLMLTSDMKIYQIAEEVGFSDYKYFSQVFKNYLSHSPSDFMQLDLFIKESKE